MARTIIFLLFLLSRSSASADGFTDWCNQLAQFYGHPVCYIPPPCTSSVEFQTLQCGAHQTGAINQSRTYFCSTQTWGPWQTTSNNCTPLPPSCQTSVSARSLSCPTHFSGQITQQATTSCPDPYGQPVPGAWITTTNSCTPDPATCIPSTQTQTLSCQPGYVGSILQNRSSTCSDPYSTPTWSDWVTTSNTCVMSVTNLNNPTSPVSPISPTNPNSVISKQMNSTTQIAPPVDVQQNPVIANTPLVDTTTTTTSQSGTTQKSESTSGTASSSTSNSTGSSETNKTEAKTSIPKGKEIVPGFGVVMSMQLLNAGYNMQQQQIQEYINLTQEQAYGREQDILLNFITSDDIGINFNSIANYRWRSLLGDNPLQRSGFGD